MILINGITDISVSSSSCPTGTFSSSDSLGSNQEHAGIIKKMKIIKIKRILKDFIFKG